MAETDLTVARLELAGEQAQAAQHGLTQRQGALLELEQTARRVRAGSLDGRVLIDQAEDVRRAMQVHRSDQLGEVRTAVARVDMTVGGDVRDRSLGPDQAAGLSAKVAAASRESRRAVSDLDQAVEALAPLAAGDGAAPELSRLAQRSIDGAAGWLEQARRATFQLTERLTEVTRELQRIDAPTDERAPGAPQVDVGADVGVATGTDRPVGDRLTRPIAPSMSGAGLQAGYSAAPGR